MALPSVVIKSHQDILCLGSVGTPRGAHMPYYPGDQTLDPAQTPFVIAPVAHPPLLHQSDVWLLIKQHTMVDIEQQEEQDNSVDDNPDRLQWFAC